MSLADLIQTAWQAASQAQSQAQAAYPELACLSGCNACCKQHGSPMTYAPEWDVIADWLCAYPQIYQQAQRNYQALKQRWQLRLLQPEPPSIAEALFDTPCPFLQAERCAIYSVRPLTCRAFGNSQLAARPVSGDDIYTCNPEKDRWEQHLPMSGEGLPERAELFAPLVAFEPPRSLLSWLEKALYDNPS